MDTCINCPKLHPALLQRYVVLRRDIDQMAIIPSNADRIDTKTSCARCEPIASRKVDAMVLPHMNRGAKHLGQIIER